MRRQIKDKRAFLLCLLWLLLSLLVLGFGAVKGGYFSLLFFPSMGLFAAADKAPKQVPGSLEESLNALERDHAFLLKGDVFTKDVIEVWLEYKRQEIDKVRLRPHPYEFHLYFDA